jgi:hypothetical protein
MADKKVSFDITAQDKTASAFSDIQKKLKGVQAELGAVGKVGATVKGVFLAVAAAVTAGAFSDLVKGAIDYSSKLVDVSEKTNIGIEDLQKLKYAADQAGLGFDGLTELVGKLDINLTKAKAGDKNALAAFADVGIDVSKVKDGNDAILKIADAYKAAGNSAEQHGRKEALAVALMGKGGKEALQFLNQGSEAIIASGEELKKFGGIIATDVVLELEAAGDRLAAVETKSQALKAVFVSGLTPALDQITTGFLGAKGGADAMKASGEVLGNMLIGLMSFLVIIGNRLQIVGNGLAAYGVIIASNFEIAYVRIAALGELLTTGKIEGGLAKISAKIKEIQNERQLALAAADESSAKANAEAKAILAGFRGKGTPAETAPAPATEGKPGKPGKPPKGGKPLGTSSIGGDVTGADVGAAEKAMVLKRKALADAAAKVGVDAEEKAQEEIRYLLDENLISYKDYYSKLATSQQTALDFRLAALQAEKKEQDDLAANGKVKEADRIKAQAESAKISAEITVTNREREMAATRAARAQAKAEEDLVKDLQDVEDKTKEILGTLTAADRGRILAEQYEDLIEKAKANGKSTAGIERQIAIETAKGSFEQAQQDISDAEAASAASASLISARLAAGMIDSADARAQLDAANRKAVQSLKELLPELQKQADLLGGPYVTAVEEAKAKITELEHSSDSLANTINLTIKDELSGAIYDAITGAKSPREALVGVFKGVGNTIAQEMANDLSSSLYKLLKSGGFDIGGMISGIFGGSGGGGGGGGIGSFIGSLFGGFESGGYTGNAGTSTAAGVVHGQEYVFSAPSVRKLGVGFLENLHRAGRRGVPRVNLGGYANGGYVDKASGMQSAPIVMNVTTPDAKSFQQSQSQIEARMSLALQRAKRNT